MPNYGPMKVAEVSDAKPDETFGPAQAKDFAATLSKFASEATGHCVDIKFKEFLKNEDPKAPRYGDYTMSIDGKPVGTLSASPGITGSGAYVFADTDNPGGSEYMSMHFADHGVKGINGESLYGAIDAGSQAYVSGKGVKAPQDTPAPRAVCLTP